MAIEAEVQSAARARRKLATLWRMSSIVSSDTFGQTASSSGAKKPAMWNRAVCAVEKLVMVCSTRWKAMLRTRRMGMVAMITRSMNALRCRKDSVSQTRRAPKG